MFVSVQSGVMSRILFGLLKIVPILGVEILIFVVQSVVVVHIWFRVRLFSLVFVIRGRLPRVLSLLVFHFSLQVLRGRSVVRHRDVTFVLELVDFLVRDEFVLAGGDGAVESIDLVTCVVSLSFFGHLMVIIDS